jgi:hypothetical protein
MKLPGRCERINRVEETMRRTLLCLPLCFLAVLTWAQTPNQARYEQQIDGDKPLRLQLHAGDYKILPGKSDSLVVIYETRIPSQLKSVSIRFDARASENLLVMEGPTNYKVRIEVPRQSNLLVRMTAGDLRIGRVEGDKNIELHAGDLDIEGFYPEEYGRVDLSVQVGDVNGGPLNVSKGGFWPRHRSLGPGKYRLHAHVGVGDLTLHAPEMI